MHFLVSTSLAAGFVCQETAAPQTVQYAPRSLRFPAMTPLSCSCFHRRCEPHWAAGASRTLWEIVNVCFETKIVFGLFPGSLKMKWKILKIDLPSVMFSSPRNFSLNSMFFSRLLSDRALWAASGLLNSKLEKRNHRRKQKCGIRQNHSPKVKPFIQSISFACLEQQLSIKLDCNDPQGTD